MTQKKLTGKKTGAVSPNNMNVDMALILPSTNQNATTIKKAISRDVILLYGDYKATTINIPTIASLQKSA